ncbi:MAG: hypothetical protein ACK49R_08750 [Planctomycetota bacterium]|jgi:hypothetical protein
MKTATHYTELPAELHRQTLYDWGRRGLRTYHGFRIKGAKGRPRCTFDPAWRHQFTAIPARSGQTQLLRRISSQTTEWVAVARRRGQFWVVAYYLVPRTLAGNVAKTAIV